MSSVRRNRTARRADTAMAAVDVSGLPAEAASCETPTHSWDMGSTVGEGDGDWDGDEDWDDVVLVVAVYTKDLRET